MDWLTEFQKWLSGDTTNATNTTGNTGFQTMPLNNFDIASGVSSGGAAGYSLSSGLGALTNG